MKNPKFIVLFVCFFALLLINSVFIFRNPWVDWDIVSYIWNVKYIESKNIEVIHKETYEELREYLDTKRYDIIKWSNKYRKDVFSDPKAFFDIMPFYNIKFIYIYSIYFISKISWMSIIHSVLAISIISYLVFSSILFVIFREELENNKLYFFPLYLLTFSSPIIIAARSTTPDMFSAMFMILWMFLIIRKNIILWILVLIISIWVRTDNVIFVLLLLFYLKFFAWKDYKIKTSSFLVWGILALWFYKWINTYFHNFGYLKLYYNSFIEPISYPSSFEVVITTREYLAIFKDKLALLLWLRENKPITFFPFYIILSFIAYIFAQKNKIKSDNIFLWLLIISTFTLLFKFAIFPNIQERYFVFYFIIIFISLTKIILNQEKF